MKTFEKKNVNIVDVEDFRLQAYMNSQSWNWSSSGPPVDEDRLSFHMVPMPPAQVASHTTGCRVVQKGGRRELQFLLVEGQSWSLVCHGKNCPKLHLPIQTMQVNLWIDNQIYWKWSSNFYFSL